MSEPKDTAPEATPPALPDGEHFGSVVQAGVSISPPPPHDLSLEQTVDGAATGSLIPDVPTADDLESLLEPSIVEYLGSLPPIPELGPDPLDGPVLPEGGLAGLMPPDEFSDELSSFALLDWPDGPDLDQLLPPPPDPPNHAVPDMSTADNGSLDGVLDGLLGLPMPRDPSDPDDPSGGMFGA